MSTLDEEFAAMVEEALKQTEFYKQAWPLVSGAVAGALDAPVDHKSAIIALLAEWLGQAVAMLSQGDQALMSAWLEGAIDKTKTAAADFQLLGKLTAPERFVKFPEGTA